MRVEVPVLQVELVGGSSGNASEYAKCRNALQAAGYNTSPLTAGDPFAHYFEQKAVQKGFFHYGAARPRYPVLYIIHAESGNMAVHEGVESSTIVDQVKAAVPK